MADFKKLLADNNIVAESCHCNMAELKNNLQERVDWAKELGMKQLILASMPVPRQNATFADWDRACDDLSKAGEQSLKSGVQIGFHNHDGEFAKIDGALIYDHIMQKLDPKAVKMQFQVSVISIGYKAEDYLADVRPRAQARPPGCPLGARYAHFAPPAEAVARPPTGVAPRDGTRNTAIEVSRGRSAPTQELWAMWVAG